jgi:hypothetical protein
MPSSIRKRVIEEWRGLPEPDEKIDRTLSIQEVLAQLAPKLGLEARLRDGLKSSAIFLENIPAQQDCIRECWW